MLTPSPKMSSPSTMTSPRLTPDPQFETTFGRERVVDRSRGPLHLDGTVQRVYDTRKVRQEAVAGGADDPPAMRRDQRVDRAAQLAERSMRAGLILAHQPAETGHIRMQDGGEFPLPRGNFLRRTRRVIEQGAHRGCV